ncbi:hypothetical protein K7432_005238 [Basidiobolus ranarum]|uniref:Uncharacterized protein n=1 Tax=Basidiobolus ranarum TaxID=34480 RepID=A0ABR2WX04_9FUNG
MTRYNSLDINNILCDPVNRACISFPFDRQEDSNLYILTQAEEYLTEIERQWFVEAKLEKEENLKIIDELYREKEEQNQEILNLKKKLTAANQATEDLARRNSLIKKEMVHLCESSDISTKSLNNSRKWKRSIQLDEGVKSKCNTRQKPSRKKRKLDPTSTTVVGVVEEFLEMCTGLSEIHKKNPPNMEIIDAASLPIRMLRSSRSINLLIDVEKSPLDVIVGHLKLLGKLESRQQKAIVGINFKHYKLYHAFLSLAKDKLKQDPSCGKTQVGLKRLLFQTIQSKLNLVNRFNFNSFKQQIKRAERLFILSNYFGRGILLHSQFTGSRLLGGFTAEEFNELRRHLIATEFLRGSFSKQDLYHDTELDAILYPFDHLHSVS